MFCYSTKDLAVLLNISVQISFESEKRVLTNKLAFSFIYFIYKLRNDDEHAYLEMVANVILSHVNIFLFLFL